MDSKRERRKLGHIATIYTGITFQRVKGEKSEKGHEYNQIKLNSLDRDGDIKIDTTDPFYTSKEIDPSFLASRGDILIRLRDPVKGGYVEEDSVGAIVPSLFAIIKCNPHKVESRYLLHYINSSLFQQETRKYISGTAIRMIRLSSIKEIEIPLPPLEEQRRIGNLLELSMREIKLLESQSEKKREIFQALVVELLKEEHHGK